MSNDKKISELSSGSPAEGTDILPIVRGTENKKISINDLLALVVQEAANGLNVDNNVVKLGGDLTENTDINASASNFYLRFINRSNGSYFGVYRDADGGNVFKLENPNAGTSANSVIQLINNGGLTSQILNSGTNYPYYGGNVLLTDKISGDIIHLLRSGNLRFYSNGFPGTERARVTQTGFNIGDTNANTHYTMPATRGGSLYILREGKQGNGTPDWDRNMDVQYEVEVTLNQAGTITLMPAYQLDEALITRFIPRDVTMIYSEIVDPNPSGTFTITFSNWDTASMPVLQNFGANPIPVGKEWRYSVALSTSSGVAPDITTTPITGTVATTYSVANKIKVIVRGTLVLTTT